MAIPAVKLKEVEPKIMVSEKKVTILLAKDDNQICAYCPELDLVTETDTANEAVNDMIKAVKEYAQEYMEDFEWYSKSPNRAHHLPYVKAIVSCNDDWELRMLLEVKHGIIQF